jgi:hypothetical protein
LPSLALITSDHGFGHVRRSLVVARALVRRSWRITLFAPVESAKRLDSTGVTLVDFKAGITPVSIASGDAANWIHRLPDLDGFDFVVCDNLVEILAVRPDAMLMGSFLWHLVLPDIARPAFEAAEKLVTAHRPIMIATRLFAIPGLEERTRLHRFGLYADEPRPTSAGGDVLIACGGSAAAERDFAQGLAKLARHHPPSHEVWVEPRLRPAGAPDWMRPASFGPDLYRRLGAAIIRPGLGTITDSLWAGVRLFTISESNNLEMTHNALRLHQAGVGDPVDDLNSGLAGAERFLADANERQAHAARVAAIDFDGGDQTANFIAALA